MVSLVLLFTAFVQKGGLLIGVIVLAFLVDSSLCCGKGIAIDRLRKEYLSANYAQM